jgi:hypothetical protein
MPRRRGESSILCNLEQLIDTQGGILRLGRGNMKWISLDDLTTPGVYWVRDTSGLRIAEYVGGRLYFVHSDGSTPISRL